MPSVTRFAHVRRSKIREDYLTGVKTFTEHFVGELDAPGNAAHLFKLHRPDLTAYQPHPDSPDCRATFFEAKQKKHILTYDVTVGYSNQMQEVADPYNEPALVDVESVLTEVPFTHDYEGKPNTNRAGEMFKDAVDEDMLLVFRVQKKLSPQYPAWLLDYGNAISKDAVTFKGRTLEPETLKVGKIRIGHERYIDDIPYLPAVLELVWNREGWRQHFLNQGTREVTIVRKPGRSGEGYRYIKTTAPILDETGKPIKEKVFLDDEGRRPRVDSSGRIITIERELRDREAGRFTEGAYTIKHPLDPEDIIVLKRTKKTPMQFNGRLPLT